MKPATQVSQRIVKELYYDKHMNQVEIAAQFGVSRQRIHQLLADVEQEPYRSKCKPSKKRSEYRKAVVTVARFLQAYSKLQDRHGDIQCYRNGCRCEPCTRTNTEHCVRIQRRSRMFARFFRKVDWELLASQVELLRRSAREGKPLELSQFEDLLGFWDRLVQLVKGKTHA